MSTIREDDDSVLKENDDKFHLVIDGETAKQLAYGKVLPWLQEKLAIFYSV